MGLRRASRSSPTRRRDRAARPDVGAAPRGPDPERPARGPAVGRTTVAVLAAGAVIVALLGGAQGAPRPAGAQGVSSTTKAPTSSTTTAPTTTAALTTTAAPTTVAPTTTTAAPTTTTTTAPPTTLPPVPTPVDTPFPARLVAPVPPVEGGPELVVSALYVAVSEDPQAPDVVVRFKTPFALPSQRYRVAVLVGDPSGERVRASFLVEGPTATPTGSVEIGTGTSWKAVGTTKVLYDPSGFIIIRLPLGATPAGGAVWAELTDGFGASPSRTTPYFDRGAFFGSADAGTLPPTPFGHVSASDGSATDAIAELPSGPVLTVVNGRIFVRYPGPDPATLLGQPVVSVIDDVRLVPNFDTNAVLGDAIRVNRTDATVGLYDGFGVVPVDKSGDRTWVIAGPPAGPAGATTLEFDLNLAASALGFTVGRDTTGVGLTRSFVLADGRFVTANGVVATAAWLDLAPPPPVTTTAAPAAGTGEGDASLDRRTVLIGAGVGLLLLLVILLVAIRVRRRRAEDRAAQAESARRAAAGDRVPWAKDDSQLTLEVERIVVTDAVFAGVDDPTGSRAAPAGPGVGAAAGALDLSASDLVAGSAGGAAAGAADDAEVPAAPDAGLVADAALAGESPEAPVIGHAGPTPWRSGATGLTATVVEAGDPDLATGGAGGAGGAGAGAELSGPDAVVRAPATPAAGVVMAGAPVGDLVPSDASPPEPGAVAGSTGSTRELGAGPAGAAVVAGAGAGGAPTGSTAPEPDAVTDADVGTDGPDAAADAPVGVDPADVLAAFDLDLDTYRNRLAGPEG